jgi:hypothetical protein
MNIAWQIARAIGITPTQIVRRILGRIVYRGRPW